jgi:branched-chain amino acid transport system ATP-binding protein
VSLPLLRLSGVTAFYGAIQALRGVDLTVNEGEIVTLIGANGAGKSTLMMTVCGQPQARDGAIVYDGEDITRLPTHAIMRKRIAQSPEGRRIFPRMTVYENLQMGAEVAGNVDFDALLQQVFSLFPRLEERVHQRGGTLSGGEQQMLAVARALVGNARLILMDEPTEGLSPQIVSELKQLVQKLRDSGLAILLVEQNIEFALDIADSVSVMDKGKIVWHGMPRDLAADEGVQKTYLGL